jgi:CDP-diacylglycerol---glycerol-3-phosphate 3-phosphatidyltransferase
VDRRLAYNRAGERRGRRPNEDAPVAEEMESEEQRKRFRLRTTPNAITASRIVMAPLTLWAHQLGSAGDEIRPIFLLLCLLGLVAAEVTDVMDGIVARRTGEVSAIGKLLDPLSDSIFRMFVFLGFLASGWMPLWMMAIFFARDILVAYLRVFSGLQNIVLAARISGKVKAVGQATCQIALVILFLFDHWQLSDQFLGFALPMPQIAFWLCFAAAGITVWSAYDYTVGVLGKALEEEFGDGASS